ncbi:hypothetical protein C0J52_13361 [Blattella germanica]|nr:hypothetical protein C0J52_13361 [Blattella germanica]
MSIPMDTSTYKHQHEEFMQNLNGTSAAEVFLVILPAPVSIFLSAFIFALASSLFKPSWNVSSTETLTNKLQFLVDFVVLIVPMVLYFTILSDYHVIITATLSMGLFVCVVYQCTFEGMGLHRQFFNEILSSPISDKKIPFITNFRALTNLMTAICILAVDFKIFPRRFAKTENFGYGLMDTGVGLFVISNALVTSKAETSVKSKSFSFTMWRTVKSTIPLFILGGLRFFATKQVDYQTHISEYGVHWNFFITLAVTRVICTLILNIVGSTFTFILPVIVITIHELILIGGCQDSSMIVVLLGIELLTRALNMVLEKNIKQKKSVTIGLNISYVPITLDAINFNGLTFFLLANIMTGLVNITFLMCALEKIHILDGGFSTQLHSHVNDPVDGTPLWSASFLHTNPDAVIKTHLDFLRAGAQILMTNTYQASIDGFMKHLELSNEESFQLIKKAVDLAKAARSLYMTEIEDCSGSVGPYGSSLHDCSEYTGSYVDHVSRKEMIDWHRPRIQALLEAGVDVLAFETIPAQAEAEALDEFHICHGEKFQDVAQKCWDLNPTQILAIGVNCVNPKYVSSLLKNINMGREENPIPLIVYPNSGENYDLQKGWIDREKCCPVETYIQEWLDLGVTYIGGCCRTYASDIVKIKDEVNKWVEKKENFCQVNSHLIL